MVANTARRVRAGLAELIELVNDPATPTADLRSVLTECKTFGGQLAVLQADAAAGLAVREHHGDGGVGVLARAAGLSKRDAVSQVKTVERLQEMPTARGALASGEISVANAKTLVAASERTSAEQVEQDEDLLAQAAVLSADQFTREAGRWAARRRADDGEQRYRRQRARRRLSFWDGDDGMVHLRGELDPVTGAKVRKRFLQESERLRRLDLHSPEGDKRSPNQRMADALDTLTSHGSIYANAAGAASDDGGGRGESGCGGDAASDRGGKCGGGGQKPSADITIVQHLSADGTDAFAEIAGNAVIPQSVLEEHFCNAQIKGVVFSSKGVPLWHGHAKRLATKAQMNALRARYGACGGCEADMWVCDGHHIRPVSQGGRTDISNMMLLCWACHQKVHHHGWRVVPDGRGLFTIAPPERIRHGPAHAPVAGLESIGFELAGASPDGVAHRYIRAATSIDVLAPEGLGRRADLTTTPPGRTIEAPGGTQALERTELVPVEYGDSHGLVPRPSLPVNAAAAAPAPAKLKLRSSVGTAAVGEPAERIVITAAGGYRCGCSDGVAAVPIAAFGP